MFRPCTRNYSTWSSSNAQRRSVARFVTFPGETHKYVRVVNGLKTDSVNEGCVQSRISSSRKFVKCVNASSVMVLWLQLAITSVRKRLKCANAVPVMVVWQHHVMLSRRKRGTWIKAWSLICKHPVMSRSCKADNCARCWNVESSIKWIQETSNDRNSVNDDNVVPFNCSQEPTSRYVTRDKCFRPWSVMVDWLHSFIISCRTCAQQNNRTLR